MVAAQAGRLPVAGEVRRDDVVLLRQRVEDRRPLRAVAGDAVDEHDARTLAGRSGAAVGGATAVDGDRRKVAHGSILAAASQQAATSLVIVGQVSNASASQL